jgi:macrolide-specific efflux system membrane fusion protein
MKLKIVLILILIVAGGGAIFVSMGGLAAQATASTYLTSTAAVGDVSDDVAATGAIAPVTSYGLAFGSPPHLATNSSDGTGGTDATWPVTSVSVAVGDRVTKGEALAVASIDDIQRDLNGAIVNRRAAALQLEIAQENLDDADSDDAVRQAKISLYQAQSQVLQAEATQRDLTAQVAAATIVAPIDGVVAAVNVVAGFDAPSGDAIIIDATTYQVTADVVESDISSISVGQPATVTVDAIGGDVSGTVAAIAPVASTADSDGVVSYGVTVALPNAPTTLRPGMTADITITTASATNVLTIPVAALGGTAGDYTVRVLGPDGVPQVRRVDVGLVTSSFAEIKAGLTAGEAVVTGTAAERAATTSQGGGFGGPNQFVGPGGGGRVVGPGN